MRPRRFLMLSTFYPPENFGGDGVFVRRLAGALAARGHEVHVAHDRDAYRLLAGGASPAPRGIDSTEVDAAGVVRHSLSRRGAALDLTASHQLGRPLAVARRLARLVRRIEPDVIHFHNVSLLGGPGVLALGGAVKLCTLHDYWFVCPMHTLWRLDREPCRRRTCLRCTLAGRRPPQLWRRFGWSARMARHVEWFLAPSRFCLETHRRNGFAGELRLLPHFAPEPAPSRPAGARAPGRPSFLFAGRLEKLKGPQTLIEAFRHFPLADLIVAGRGSLEGSLRRAARGMENVRFLGWVDGAKLQELKQRAVAVVIPSLCYETFGLVAVEAWAAGTPAIVRRRGALAELAEREEGAVAYESRHELYEAMRMLIDSPERRRRLAEAGRERYLQTYSEEVHLARYLDLIREAEARRSGVAE